MPKSNITTAQKYAYIVYRNLICQFTLVSDTHSTYIHFTIINQALVNLQFVIAIALRGKALITKPSLPS